MISKKTHQQNQHSNQARRAFLLNAMSVMHFARLQTVRSSPQQKEFKWCLRK
jgi:hypothetical protein